MSRIASRASRVSASGSTCRKRRPAASTVDTPSVGQQAVLGVVRPEREQRLVGEVAHRSPYRSLTDRVGFAHTPNRRQSGGMATNETQASGSSTTPWARCGCRPTPAGGRRPSGRSRTSRSRAGRIDRELIGALASIKGAGGDGQRPAQGDPEGHGRRRSTTPRPRWPRGDWDDQFPIDVFQTGSGTSSNMNMNEVIASLASERLGRAGPPERPRERVAVVERRVPVGHPPRRRPVDRSTQLLPGARAPRARAAARRRGGSARS